MNIILLQLYFIFMTKVCLSKNKGWPKPTLLLFQSVLLSY